ncbi:MAG TPA: VOC family protein [Caulobacteraceae bacterium]|jgi:catechol 2,3-dioxygenase-like lactoylglutathione lyase family enzyme
MDVRFRYAIKFVADMDRAVAFYRDTFGLKVTFATPFWSEFETGDVTLALHPASDKNPAGGVEIGFSTENLAGIYAERAKSGLDFIEAPRLEHGTLLSRILDCEGAGVSLSGKP